MQQKRGPLILVIALMTLLGSLVTLGATVSERSAVLRGFTDPLRTTNLPFRIPLLGINVDLRQYNNEDSLAQQLELMKAVGIHWVRQFVYWSEVERIQGERDWAAYDAVFAQMATSDTLRPVAVIMNSPTWARDPQLPATAPPDDPAEFGAFVSQFAERYGHIVDHYQVWDEPNLEAAWGGLQPNPAGYLALLAEAHSAVRRTDPGAVVIAAALAPTTENNLRNISDLVYLETLYRLGAQVYFDAAAGKPYGFNSSPDDLAVRPDHLNISRFIALREVMERYGDDSKHLWGSSFGWNFLPETWSGSASVWGQVTQAQQVSYTLNALERADRQWAWVGGMILENWQASAPPDDPAWGFSLVDQDDNPSALYSALQSRPQGSVARHGHHPAAISYASYSGVWTFGALGADIGWVNDSQLSFEFEGTGVGLLLRQGNYVAFLYPRIDGRTPNGLPVDSEGAAYIALQSDDLQQTLTVESIADDLENSSHQLSVIADRGWDQWALAGYAVSSGNPARHLENQLVMAALTCIISLGAVIISAAQIDWRPAAQKLNSVMSRLGETGQLAVSVVTSLALMLGMLLTWGDAVPNILRRDSAQLGLAIVTAGLIYVSPAFVVTVAAAAVLFVMFYHRTDLGLVLTLFFAPFFLFPVELWRFAFPMAEVMILLTSAAWLLKVLARIGRQRQALPRSMVQMQLPKQLHPLDVTVAALAILGVVSLLWTANRGPALTELRTLILEPLAFYVILRTHASNARLHLTLVDTLIASGVIVCLIGLFLFLRGDAIITAEDGARRLASVYGSPNNVGLWLGRCLPFAAAFVLIRVDTRRTISAACCVVLMLITVLLTQSAGAIFVGIPVGLAAVVILAIGRRGLLPLGGLIGALAAGFLIAVQSERFARLLSLSDGTNFFRVRVWQSALNIIRDYPLTGLGMDQFLYRFRGHYILPDAWQEPNLSHPHNIVLDFWTRLGILAVAVLIWMQISFWRTTLTTYHRVRHQVSVAKAINVGMMSAMVALLAHGMIDNSVFVQDLGYVYMLLLGLAASSMNTRAIDGDPKTVM